VLLNFGHQEFVISIPAKPCVLKPQQVNFYFFIAFSMVMIFWALAGTPILIQWE
jgi:hypothetical protein